MGLFAVCRVSVACLRSEEVRNRLTFGNPDGLLVVYVGRFGPEKVCATAFFYLESSVLFSKRTYVLYIQQVELYSSSGVELYDKEAVL